jgi:hypothetical protein
MGQVSQRKTDNHSAKGNDQAGTFVDYAGIVVGIKFVTDSAIVPPFASVQIRLAQDL